jgi:hypothetical protein
MSSQETLKQLELAKEACAIARKNYKDAKIPTQEQSFDLEDKEVDLFKLEAKALIEKCASVGINSKGRMDDEVIGTMCALNEGTQVVQDCVADFWPKGRKEWEVGNSFNMIF